MTKKQVLALFFTVLPVWTVGNGLLPLLPVYAAQLGADSAWTGYYLACCYLALVIGMLSAGQIADRLQTRKVPLLVTLSLMVPSLWLLGQAATLWQLAVFTGVTWLLLGASLSLSNILTGLCARESERGQVFGILAVTAPIGALLGGLSFGAIVDASSFSILFWVVGGFVLFSPVAASFLHDPRISQSLSPTPQRLSQEHQSLALGKGYWVLVLATILAGLVIFCGRLGTSLAMQSLQFSHAAISSTTAIGGAVTLPLPLLFGKLSDRTGRKILLALCYSMGAAGLIILIFSVSLTQYWLAASLLSILAYGSSGVGGALVADLIPHARMGKGMSLFNAAQMMGGVIGFLFAGVAFQEFGMPIVLALAGSLALVAIGVLVPIRSPSHR